MQTDTLRLIATYGIAILVLLGSFALLWVKIGEISAESLLALVTFVAGTVLGFVFNRESTTAGARAAERAIGQGQASVQPPTP